MPSKRPNGYLGRYRDADGNERSKLFRDEDGAAKTRAKNWEQEQRAAVRRGTDIDPNAGKIKVSAFAEQWRTAQLHHRTLTEQQVEMVLRLHLLPHLGGRSMSKVKPDAIRSLVARWEADGAAPATIATRFSIVSSMFRSAVRDGVIGRSPCTGARLPEQVEVPVVPLTAEQVLTLIDAVHPAYLRPVVVAGAGLGVRIGEALGLTVDRVQFLRREVVIDRQQESDPPYGLVPRKNAKRRPRYVVPLPDYVGKVLSTLTPGPAGRLFTNDLAKLIPAGTAQQAITRAVKRSGLPAGTTFHDLRHAYVSRLIEHGESVVTVAARIGDAPSTVLRYYGHLFPDSDERTRKIIDAMFEQDVDQLRTSGSSGGD